HWFTKVFPCAAAARAYDNVALCPASCKVNRPVRSMGPFILPLRMCTLVEGKDLNPVRALAGGIASDQFEAPFSASIAYDESVSDFSPATTTKRPVGSMANPRGCFSVGVLPRYVSFPLVPSTRNAPSVLVVRSEA